MEIENRFKIIAVTGNIGSHRRWVAEKLQQKLGIWLCMADPEQEVQIVSDQLNGIRHSTFLQVFNERVTQEVLSARVRCNPLIISGPLWGRICKTLTNNAHSGKGELIEVRCHCDNAGIGFARFTDLCDDRGVELPPISMELYKRYFHEEQHLACEQYHWRLIPVDTADTTAINFNNLVESLVGAEVVHA